MDKKIIIFDLLNFSSDKTEISNVLNGFNESIEHTFKECVDFCFTDIENGKFETEEMLKIDSIICYLHDELNTGHWSDIPIKTRLAFTASNYLKTIIILKTESCCSKNVLEECLKAIDLGLLLGAPLENNSDCLTNCAKYLSGHLQEKTQKISSLKRKNIDEFTPTFEEIAAIQIKSVKCPSLETFNTRFFSPQIPVKLQDCIQHWPALTKWLDVNYLLKTAGNRTVPVEIGSHYTDEDWSQKLMKIKDFINNYFLETKTEIGYLAQHNLFDQIPELKNDIHIPDYCCLGDNEADPDINAWFGPEGTVSPLHHDPKNNILAQIFGTKQLILFPPSDSAFLSPHEGPMLSNTSQIDPLKPDLTLHPNFTKATMYKCLLAPGEMLFMPKKWWHHVTALDKSFSVSFWWE